MDILNCEMVSTPHQQRDPIWANREAAKINLALKKVGYSDAMITKWWNHSGYKELGGRSPTDAWNREEFDSVKALVEHLVSERFATALGNNPEVRKRLTESPRP